MAVDMGCKQDAKKQNYWMTFAKFKTSLVVVSVLLFIIALATLIVVIQTNHKQYQATKAHSALPSLTEDELNALNGYFGGDGIVYDKEKFERIRRALGKNIQLWPKDLNGQLHIPYVIDPSLTRNPVYEKRIRGFIQQMNEVIQCNANVWKPRTNENCQSFVGRVPLFLQPQPIKLGHGCIVYNNGSVLHEMMHAMGFYHEHARSDRDKYVKVNLANVRPGAERNFRKEETIDFGSPYDYGSVMHYGPLTFSKDGRLPTLEKLDKTNKDVMGQRNGLSEQDKYQINRAYGCLKTTTESTTTLTTTTPRTTRTTTTTTTTPKTTTTTTPRTTATTTRTTTPRTTITTTATTTPITTTTLITTTTTTTTPKATTTTTPRTTTSTTTTTTPKTTPKTTTTTTTTLRPTTTTTTTPKTTTTTTTLRITTTTTMKPRRTTTKTTTPKTTTTTPRTTTTTTTPRTTTTTTTPRTTTTTTTPRTTTTTTTPRTTTTQRITLATSGATMTATIGTNPVFLKCRGNTIAERTCGLIGTSLVAFPPNKRYFIFCIGGLAWSCQICPADTIFSNKCKICVYKNNKRCLGGSRTASTTTTQTTAKLTAPSTTKEPTPSCPAYLCTVRSKLRMKNPKNHRQFVTCLFGISLGCQMCPHTLVFNEDMQVCNYS